jgi:hypothetical protein
MTLSLYSTWRAWRRDVAAERAASAAGHCGASPVYDAIALLGVGLAGIACGGDRRPDERFRGDDAVGYHPRVRAQAEAAKRRAKQA